MHKRPESAHPQLTIRHGISQDMTAISDLLFRCCLPVDDIPVCNPEHFILALDGPVLIACGGLEIFQRNALLRSLAVTHKYRAKGIGLTLLNELEKLAVQADVRTLYLLTDSAESWFSNNGFNPIKRHQAPTTIRDTKQFTAICPDSAVLMKKNIQRNGIPL